MKITITNNEIKNTLDTTKAIITNNELDLQELALMMESIDFDIDDALDEVNEAETELMGLEPIDEGPVHVVKTLDGLDITIDDDVLITYNKHIVKFTSWVIRTGVQIAKIAIPAIKVFSNLVESATADFNKLFNGDAGEEESKSEASDEVEEKDEENKEESKAE